MSLSRVLVEAIVYTILGMILAGSLSVWGVIVWRSVNGHRWIEANVPVTRPRPFFAVALTFAWILYSSVAQLFQSSSPPDFQHLQPAQAMEVLASNIAVQITVTCLLMAALTRLGERQLTRYGIDGRHRFQKAGYGLTGYLLAAIPVYAVSAAMLPFRTEENQHPFLQILRDQQSWPLISLLVVTAVVLAPLQEELIYRVIFQGVLQRMFQPSWAIICSSAFFAAVHGFPDAVGLFPLALVLGYLYWRTGSYLTVVVTHGVFNGVSLLLTLLCPEC